VFKIVRTLNGKVPNNPTVMIINRNETESQKKEENLWEWGKYFQTLLNMQLLVQDEIVIDPTPEDLQIETSDFSFLEMTLAVRSLKKEKALSCDAEIVPESVK